MAFEGDRGATILLVEDEAMLREVLAARLRRGGFKVAVACNGLEALAMFRHEPDAVGLLIADVDIPFVSGITVAQSVTEVRPECPVLLISGKPLPTGVEPGRWEFLPKPFEPHVLLATVRNLFATREADPTLRPRVILAEDDAEVRDRLCGLLRTNYDVVAAVDGARAVLKSAEELHPEIILLDIGMPGMNGFAVARVLHRSMPSVPLLFVTQHSDPAYVEEAFASGGAGYVLKRNVVSELGVALEQVRSGGRYLSPCLRDESDSTLTGR